MRGLKPGKLARQRLAAEAEAIKLADVDALRAELYQRRATELADLLAKMVRCQDCGRPLSDPVSVERGVGPECWAKRQERVA